MIQMKGLRQFEDLIQDDQLNMFLFQAYICIQMFLKKNKSHRLINLIVRPLKLLSLIPIQIKTISNLNNNTSQQMSHAKNQASQSQDHSQDRSEVVAKKQEEGEDVITCEKCTKIFMNQAAYNTHVKTKHAEPDNQEEAQQQSNRNTDKKPVKKVPFKNRMLQIQQNELEDTIYAFLGELGQKNAQPVSNRSEFILHNESQRLTGQTNYSLNKVVRTPYEQPIKATDNLPNEEIEKSPHKEFLLGLKTELKDLEEKIEAQREMWELRDPMAPQQQTQDQFSLMDIRKLIMNYPKRKLTLKHPHFSIFILWVARICKPPAFRQFFIVIGTYLAKFSSVPEHQRLKEQTCYELWRNYFKANETKLIEREVVDKLEICDEKNCKKFIEYFVDWTEKFRAMVI